MTHQHCTKAERHARELRAALVELRAHALHQWRVDGDIAELDMILDHLADHSADLHTKGA
jgi:hypothetical protein